MKRETRKKQAWPSTELPRRKLPESAKTFEMQLRKVARARN
jgi:hypothetical protein